MGCRENVVGYVRVSTDEQGESRVGLDAQRAMIEAECAQRGWTLVRIEEDVSSGRSINRPGLTRALDAVTRGEVGGLIVSKLDRLSRSVAHFATLLERFRRNGWGLVILDIGIDTTTIMGEAMATMAATFAQLERRRIGERTSEALAVKKAQGIRVGRPPGSREIPDPVRTRIRRLRARGWSYARIAERLNDEGVPTARGGRWHAATVRGVA